jgi:hypothetical protein
LGLDAIAEQMIERCRRLVQQWAADQRAAPVH